MEGARRVRALRSAIAVAGFADLAQRVTMLGGTGVCPKCGEELSIRHEILEPSEL
jgi:hypothetical protein